jgi:hypothetical protein
MFEQVTDPGPPNAIGDWCLRGGIALAFVAFGWEKFSTNGHWVKLFQQIGIGQWFRYFTGVVEILGGLLVLIPWNCRPGPSRRHHGLRRPDPDLRHRSTCRQHRIHRLLHRPDRLHLDPAQPPIARMSEAGLRHSVVKYVAVKTDPIASIVAAFY